MESEISTIQARLVNMNLRYIGYMVLVVWFVLSCGKLQFREYPPEKFLSVEEQSVFLNSFIKSLYDTISPITQRELNDLKSVYKLQYYVEDATTKCFLITYDANILFKNAAYRFYGGTFVTDEIDTAFHVQFERETTTTCVKEVNGLFGRVLKNEEVSY